MWYQHATNTDLFSGAAALGAQGPVEIFGGGCSLLLPIIYHL